MKLPLKIVIVLGISCVVCLFLVFALRIQAQDKTKGDVIATKPELSEMQNMSKMEGLSKAKQQTWERQSRFRQRQASQGVDFGENAAFYRVIIDNNLFRPLGWTPPKNEPAYSLVGTVVAANGTIAEATLLEKRSNQYHFVTVGEKLGDMTVKDIQAKQVTLDKAGETITLKTGALQFLATNRRSGGKASGERREGQSEKEANSQANAKQQMDAAKRRQMEMQKQAAALGINPKELEEKLRASSPEGRQEITREIRRRAGANRRAANRRRNNK